MGRGNNTAHKVLSVLREERQAYVLQWSRLFTDRVEEVGQVEPGRRALPAKEAASAKAER